MVIKDSIFVSVSFDDTAEALLLQWKRVPSFDQFKDTYLAVLGYVKETRLVTSFCTDLTVIGSLKREHEDWLAYEYYPKVFEIIRSEINAAVVFSEDHFKAIVTNYQQPEYHPRQDFINFNYFTDFDEAIHWLINTRKGQENMVS